MKLTSERVSSLLNIIKEALPSACVLLSIEHETDKGQCEMTASQVS